MRRERTFFDWGIVILLALIGLTVALLVLTLIENRYLHDVIDQFEQDSEPEPTATGGAEIIIPKMAPVAEWLFPLAETDYRMFTSPFGYRISPFLNVEVWHEGLDVVGVWWAQVVAVADGTVVVHWPPPDGYWRGHDIYGGMVIIQHTDGMRTLYAHLSSTRVHQRDVVKAGDIIGRMGATGKADGAHLHIEVLTPDGIRQNPALYIPDPRSE